MMTVDEKDIDRSELAVERREKELVRSRGTRCRHGRKKGLGDARLTMPSLALASPRIEPSAISQGILGFLYCPGVQRVQDER